jgi:hypothetical protein
MNSIGRQSVVGGKRIDQACAQAPGETKQQQGVKMKTYSTTKTLIASAAFAGLIGGSTIRLQAATGDAGATVKASAGQLADSSEKGDTHACAGENDCKGRGGCKSSDNGCKGKNTCKGKGGCATKKPAA